MRRKRGDVERGIAVAKFEQYLKSHNLEYVKSIDNGAVLITMAFPAPKCPGKWVEGCVWFYKECMEARTYYSETGANFCRKSEHRDELFRLLNFLNARVFLYATDGFGNRIYNPHLLYNPRIYMTEDDCFDITITTTIPYDFYELAPLETADYLTMFCVELLKDLSAPIFFLLLGEWSVDQSISYVERAVLKEG